MIETFEYFKQIRTSTIPMILEYDTELKDMFLTFTKKREDLFKITDDEMFERDSSTFDTGVKEWKNRLKIHIKTVIDDLPDFENKIEILKKCELLNLNNLELDPVCAKILTDIIISKFSFY
jgi:hypothetical protein